MNKKSDNNVHLHGFVNDVRINPSKDGNKTFINTELATYEQFTNNAGEKEKKWTKHTLNTVTSDPAIIKQFEEMRDALANNQENRGVEGFKPQTFTASVDGTLVTRENEKDGVKYSNELVVVNPEDFQLRRREEGESMNTASFKGNIAKVDMYDGFALVTIGTHYYAPGESQIHTGETKPYTEKTSFVKTRVNESFRGQVYNDLKDGKIGVGDFIEARGQMHNNNFTDKNGVKRYGIVVDLNKLEVLAKKQNKEQTEAKAQKEAPAQTAAKKETVKKAPGTKTKNAPGPVKKATPNKGIKR